MSPTDLDVGPDRGTGGAEATSLDHLERRTVLGVWGAGAFAAAVRGAAADLGVAVASSADRPQGAMVLTVAGPGPSTAELRGLADAGLAVRPGPAAVSLTEPGTAAGVLAVAGLAVAPEAVADDAAALVVVVVRSRRGWTACYPAVETIGLDAAPDLGAAGATVATVAVVDAQVERRAEAVAVSIADGVDLAGTMAVELVLGAAGPAVRAVHLGVPEAVLVALAGCATSPAENHVRAVLDRPLGAVA